MIFAGPCLLADDKDIGRAMETAEGLKGVADYYRIKLWGGGTKADRYFPGIGKAGISILEDIQSIIPVGTEVQLPDHINMCNNLDYIWIGCRNSQNYGLLEEVTKRKRVRQAFLIKRDFAQSVDEICNMFDLLKEKFLISNPFIIERGVNIFDRQDDCRWSISINDLLRIKNDRPDVFENLIIDCSHSAGRKEFVKDIYNACKAIGCNHFMFECTIDGVSLTDSRQIITVKELKKILC